jgi:hypothetical protein
VLAQHSQNYFLQDGASNTISLKMNRDLDAHSLRMRGLQICVKSFLLVRAENSRLLGAGHSEPQN